ncbi:MAG: hypothetical protein LBT94_03315 [Prevotellaceae bacterium]|jgi:hypothetical protein|nr:hypothetical protein [Prevotellaceae bacterium]
MANTRVLITVKTYPTLSAKYDELVCTAGFREDGSWIRIYPVPFRKLDYSNQYQKWQWIEADLVKNTSDFRPESFRLANLDNDFVISDKIGTKNSWAERKKIVLKNVCTNMDKLIAQAKNKNIATSLATLKPQKVIDFVWKEVDREWDKKKLEVVYGNLKQQNLFEPAQKLFRIVKKLPYEFSYIFTTDDGKTRKLMIEDWELGQLYWNCLNAANNVEQVACEKVKQKYFDEFVKTKDLYLFLGTTKQFHNVGPDPFIVIGTFYPPKDLQGSLF